jgi:hypothetical protein
MLPLDLIERIEKQATTMRMKDVVEQINRMTCNKRVRDKEVAKNPKCKFIYRKMFFNHYGMFDKA